MTKHPREQPEHPAVASAAFDRAAPYREERREIARVAAPVSEVLYIEGERSGIRSVPIDRTIEEPSSDIFDLDAPDRDDDLDDGDALVRWEEEGGTFCEFHRDPSYVHPAPIPRKRA
jgi:hypothetical protein